MFEVKAILFTEPHFWPLAGPVGVQLGSSHGTTPEEDPDTIHIFSVASGHMYERLQKIMILSVIRNTRCAQCICSESALSMLFVHNVCWQLCCLCCLHLP